MADIFCSFELEPRTLSQGQLNQAREVAAGEAQNLVPRQLASALFNEGVMHPRKEVKQMGENGGHQVDENCMAMEKEEVVVVDKKASQCSCCRTAITQSSHHHHTHVKEPLSAPF